MILMNLIKLVKTPKSYLFNYEISSGGDARNVGVWYDVNKVNIIVISVTRRNLYWNSNSVMVVYL